MNSDLRRGLLKTLLFHEVWGHAPTFVEWAMSYESDGGNARWEEAVAAARELVRTGEVEERVGRVFLAATDLNPEQLRRNEIYAPRKLRKARGVTRWLARISSVRFVALCNTVALGHARDESDLDFFIVARHGTLMQTRGLSALPFKILGRRPSEKTEQDTVCLSYFVSDAHLNLSDHMLQPDDPYFRYWFLSLLPLYDDGVSAELWQANEKIRARHPLSRPWIVPPDLRVAAPRLRLPVFYGLEKTAGRLQRMVFPPAIRDAMNRDTRVIVSDKVLKFHVDDRREEYRRKYEEKLRITNYEYSCHSREGGNPVPFGFS